MLHAPDILALSQYDPELGEVAAFEELIGSHGGLGGFQTRPFILHPTEWELDEPVPLGAPAIYRNLRRWLGTIGIDLAKTPAAAVRAGPCSRAGAAAAATATAEIGLTVASTCPARTRARRSRAVTWSRAARRTSTTYRPVSATDRRNGHRCRITHPVSAEGHVETRSPAYHSPHR